MQTTSTRAQATTTATHKGHTYRVLWQGPTRYGRRAHLQFMDGSRDFWVDATALGGEAASATRTSSRRPADSRGRRYCCDECGEWHTEGDGTRCWETGVPH